MSENYYILYSDVLFYSEIIQLAEHIKKHINYDDFYIVSNWKLIKEIRQLTPLGLTETYKYESVEFKKLPKDLYLNRNEITCIIVYFEKKEDAILAKLSNLFGYKK